MNFAELGQHKIFAWDMDGTLVDGPRSVQWRHYLRSRPDATHYVLTFRTGKSRIDGKSDLQSWADDVFDELEDHHIGRNWIKGVFGIPPKIFATYGHSPRYKVEEFHTPEVQEFLMLQQEMLEWKGFKAHELGATVLIDDMEKMVIQGCRRYGVQFISSI